MGVFSTRFFLLSLHKRVIERVTTYGENFSKAVLEFQRKYGSDGFVEFSLF